MLQSKLFTKTRKETPADEVSKNAELLIKGGFINKEMAGVYSFLPLGLRVLKNIERIIRGEMNAIGGQEVLLTTLQDPELWKKSGRWDDSVVDNWFKTKLVNGGELGVANTHEEPLVKLLTQHIDSYKDLPLYVYQFQTKFRNELRAKSGLIRAREFLMKDLYSFSRTEEEFKEFYEACAGAYTNIFERVGIGTLTYRTVAAGGAFTTGMTDEFQTLSSAGEDVIYIDKQKGIAINKEVYTDENIKKFGLDKSALEEAKSIEVGNIFPLGTKYSEALGLHYLDEDGGRRPVVMGSYGIGLGRLMGTVAEVLSDEKGIIWPEAIAPFKVHLLELSGGEEVKNAATSLYEALQKNGIEVLYDERESASAGEKFADADLIGLPYRAVVSKKSLAAGGVEVKRRAERQAHVITAQEFIKQAR
ncbi:MAG: proline--tRNA ligase [Patescibacteria group bacterium]|nr:MAG: proline--tRNA ligase [Patescibacteria group bacterium]